MSTVVIENARILTMNDARDILDGGVLIRDGRFEAVGEIPDGVAADLVLDASGLTMIPGLIQTHVHLCQTLFRNRAEDLQLLEWLKSKIWPFEAAHDAPSLSASARLGIAELLKGGTTTIMDMGTVHHTDAVFEAIRDSGIRACCGKAMMDDVPDAPKSMREETAWSIDESLRLLEKWHGSEADRIRYAFAPRFVLSCSESLLKEVGKICEEKKVLFHTHSSENQGELEAVRDRIGFDNVEYFDHIGVTGPRLCLAHCIWLSSRELDILQETGTRVLHCPSANLKLGSGVAMVPEMLDRNIAVSIGADGAPCNNNMDMFVEMRLAGLIQKPRLGTAALSAKAVFEMATLGGARALGLDDTGSIEPGKRADLVLIDLETVGNQPAEDIYSQLVYSAQSKDVRTVLVDGRLVVNDGALQTLDEKTVVEDARREIQKVLERVGE